MNYEKINLLNYLKFKCPNWTMVVNKF
jgi:hypothetical protein